MNAAYLNVNELAAALGRHRSYVSAMRKAGYCPEIPGRYTLEGATAWLKSNPGFRAWRTYHPQKRRPASTAEAMAELSAAVANSFNNK
jgi:hypothetical protein